MIKFSAEWLAIHKELALLEEDASMIKGFVNALDIIAFDSAESIHRGVRGDCHSALQSLVLALHERIELLGTRAARLEAAIGLCQDDGESEVRR